MDVGRTVLPSASAAGAFPETRADGKTVRPTSIHRMSPATNVFTPTGILELKAELKLKRSAVVQRISDLAEAGRSQVHARLGELRSVQEVDGLGAERQRLLRRHIPRA